MSKLNKQKTIVVLGSGRGGTSVMAGLLKIIGVDMGNTIHPTKFNPRGSFEDEDFVEMNRKILNRPNKDFSGEIQTLIKHKSKGKKLWGWKNPSTILTIDKYLPYLTNPYFVIIIRNPINNALSMVKYSYDNKLDFPQPLTLMEAINRVHQSHQKILEIAKKYPQIPKLFVSFENLINDPIKEMQKVAKILEITLNNKDFNRIKKFIIPEEKKKNERKKGEIKRVIYFALKCLRSPHRIPMYIRKVVAVYHKEP